MDQYIKRNYESVFQAVIKPFVSLCSIHDEQKSIISKQTQPVLASIQARGFLTHLQMDLMDLRNLPCTCSCHRKHNWIIHIIDHFTKYSWLYPLKNKQAEDVLECLSQFCCQFGFLQKMHTDNAQENFLMSQFCKKNGITQLYGAPRNHQLKVWLKGTIKQ